MLVRLRYRQLHGHMHTERHPVQWKHAANLRCERHLAGHDDLPLGMREHLPDARFEVEDAGGSFEFLEHAGEERAV